MKFLAIFTSCDIVKIEVIEMFEKKLNKVLSLSVAQILPNPNQPRVNFDQQGLLELAQSIKEYGVLQPITVRRVRSGYELIAGERRVRACRMVGIERIPAIVMEMDNSASSILAMIENMQRENLGYLEEAEGFYNLITNFGLTQEELAKRVGKSQAAIANKLRILKLDESVKRNLITANLTERHARALLRLNEPQLQLEAIAGICGRGLNVKQTEEFIEEIVKAEEMAKKLTSNNEQRTTMEKFSPSENYENLGAIRDVRVFAQTIKRAVDMLNRGGIKAEAEEDLGEGFMEYRVKIAI